MLFIPLVELSVTRHRRDLFDLYAILDFHLPEEHSTIDFLSYGCWCGMSGSGSPVDALDRFVFE